MNTPLIQDFLDHPNGPRKRAWRVCSVCGRIEQITVSAAHKCPATGRCGLCQVCDECDDEGSDNNALREMGNQLPAPP